MRRDGLSMRGGVGGWLEVGGGGGAEIELMQRMGEGGSGDVQAHQDVATSNAAATASSSTGIKPHAMRMARDLSHPVFVLGCMLPSITKRSRCL